MSQVSSGIRAVLSHPAVYSLFQAALGAHAVRSALVSTYVRPTPGISVLDIGCGPADILEYLPGVSYWGFDISSPYIEQARRRYGDRGNFSCKELTHHSLSELPAFDMVLAIGLLHHLDDSTALSLMGTAKQALKVGGRLVTLDPCLQSGQHPIARFLIKRDRGLNVRNLAGYERLASGIFPNPRVVLRNKSGIPYTHCIMECTRT